MSSTQPPSDLSTTQTTPTTSLSNTPSTNSSSPTDGPSNVVHINNLFILAFVALILVFIVTCCTVLMRRRDRRRLYTEAITDGLIRGPRLPGPVPILHDIKVSRGGPGWQNIMPVAADAIEASIMPATRPYTNTSSINDTNNDNYNGHDGDASMDTKSAYTVLSASGTNQVRIDVVQVAVLIAMPNPASSQGSRRNRGRLKRAPSEGEQRSTEVRDKVHEDDSYDHDESPILMIGVTRVSPSDCMVSEPER